MDLEGFVRERWDVGDVAWFEYHCLESPESADAEIWYRSHQQVTVIVGPRYDDKPVDEHSEPWPDFSGRCEDGSPWEYRVRFADGLEWSVFEDELLTSTDGYYRPDPPSREAVKSGTL